MAKKPTVAQLHKRLQPIFNHYIRLRDTHIDNEGNRVGTCISCGADQPYERLQAGHFVPANCYYLRYDEDNVSAQCVSCNLYKRGNAYGYMVGLAERLGQYEVFELVKSRNNKREYTVELLLEAIAHYQEKVNEYDR